MVNNIKPAPINRIEINVDCGEAFGLWQAGPDEALMPLIDAANVACGGHAGDPVVMRRTVALAKQFGVKVGARESMTIIPANGRSGLSRQGGFWPTSSRHVTRTSICRNVRIAIHRG